MALNHLGIILDGNRRYAKKLGLKTWDGHREGANRVKDVIDESLAFGIKNLTLYTFSTENFKRDGHEVEFLMKLFKEVFKKVQKSEDFTKKGIRLRFAGDRSLFPRDVQEIMVSLEEKMKDNNRISVNFAMGYGGRSEILNAVKRIIDKGFSSEDVDEKLISENLYIKEDLDLLIRTGGEKRTSGFLPWQGVYAELMFIDKLWPEFTKDDFKRCINEFEQRNRRFGQ